MYEYVGADHWKRITVFNLAYWKNGLVFKNFNFSSSGRPVIKIAELKSGITDQTKFTDGKYDQNVLVQEGDMLFSWSGNPDTSIDIFRWEGAEGWLNQHIFKVTPSHGVDEDFLFFLLRWLRPRFAEIASNKQTTGLGHVTLQDFKTMSVGLPDLLEQKAIVSFVKPLQDKINLNRRTNETLEALAQALFKDWFVDFGPTRAKAEGRPPYLAPEIWGLFPDALDEEDKPAGWEYKSLDEVASFLNGLASQKYPPEADDFLPVIKIVELRNGIAEKTRKASPNIPPQYVVKDGDVLFSWSGSLIHLIWTGGHGALNQHLFKVTSERFPKWFYYFWIGHHIPTFQAIASSKATTMGHIQRHHLTEALAVIPHKLTLKATDAVLSPMFNRIIANDLESRTLTQLRDLLLPKLMSGEIRLHDAEKAVEVVL